MIRLIKFHLIVFLIMYFNSASFAGLVTANFISADGDIAQCVFKDETLEITVMSPQKTEMKEILKHVESASGVKYENSSVIFLNKRDEAMIQIGSNPEKRFVAADKYSGMVSAGGGDVSDYYFSNAVEVIYVIKTGDTFLYGNWYLLKGEPLKNDPPDHNTTLFELLEPDKSEFQCFLREPENPDKLLLLQANCDVNLPTGYYLTKQ